MRVMSMRVQCTGKGAGLRNPTERRVAELLPEAVARLHFDLKLVDIQMGNGV